MLGVFKAVELIKCTLLENIIYCNHILRTILIECIAMIAFYIVNSISIPWYLTEPKWVLYVYDFNFKLVVLKHLFKADTLTYQRRNVTENCNLIKQVGSILLLLGSAYVLKQ